MITTMSDKELLKFASIIRADDAEKYDFSQHGWSAETMVTYLAKEALQLRAQLRHASQLLADIADDDVRRDPSEAEAEAEAIDKLLGMWADGSTIQPVLP